MSSVDFSSILAGATLGSIEKPKPLPIGSYSALIKSLEQREFDKKDGTGKSRVLTVHVETTAPLGDVSEGDIEAAGGVAKIIGKKLKIDFFVTPDSLFRIQDFMLEHVKLDCKGMEMPQALPLLINQQVGVRVNHRPDPKNPEVIYAEVERTFAL